ncbi:MAG: hypothetical protein KF824_04960 [Fimbriimonadaceae bacterium]|nr:MAG: hypothetical protein KF824_04960 [Fimbriimonadaceae bacterium]
MRNSIYALSALAILTIGLGAYQWIANQQKSANSNRLAYTENLRQPEKKEALNDYVEKNLNSPDTSVQDSVSAARMKLAYIEANEKNLEEARAIFLETEAKHKGSDAQDPSYGEVIDQARYQAINCLMAEGKVAQARDEYVEFIQDRPLSPLVYGVHKRLIKMLPEGKSREDYDQLLQVAVDKQQANAKREMALCGPRCIQEFYKAKNLSIPSLDILEKECGTSEDGTSMAGIQKSLESRGFSCEGLLVDNNDFRRKRVPFIWLNQEHYLLVKQIKPAKVLVYDPFIKNDREISIPAASDKSFSATILTIQSNTTGAKK